jgi:conjugal transfer ATP-binding protein TraC
MQCFSVRQYPKYFRMGNMGSMIGDYYQMALSIPCPFLITMGAITLDYESARSKALMKAARATQAAGSYMAHFQPDLQDRKRDWDMVLRAFDNGRNVVQMYHQIVLLSRIETYPEPNMPSVPSGARAVSIWPRMSICSIRPLWHRCRAP